MLGFEKSPTTILAIRNHSKYGVYKFIHSRDYKIWKNMCKWKQWDVRSYTWLFKKILCINTIITMVTESTQHNTWHWITYLELALVAQRNGIDFILLSKSSFVARFVCLKSSWTKTFAFSSSSAWKDKTNINTVLQFYNFYVQEYIAQKVRLHIGKRLP